MFFMVSLDAFDNADLDERRAGKLSARLAEFSIERFSASAREARSRTPL
jgi:hypothetical protein